jgi:hypothetical protein
LVHRAHRGGEVSDLNGYGDGSLDMKKHRVVNGLALLLVGGLMFSMSFQPEFVYETRISIAFIILRAASVIAMIAGAILLLIPAAALLYYSFTERKK